MKRVLSILMILIFVGLVGGTFWFLYAKSQKKPTVYKTEKAEITDIVKKTVATGALVPRKEVEIKPRVSGVLETLSVVPGQLIKAGEPIAKIQIVPDAQNLNSAESGVRAARIGFDNARRELERNQKLFAQGVTSEAELATWKTSYQLKKQELAAASANLQLVKDGATKGSGKNSNIIVTSTVDGMVIDVPVKEGFSVTESNNFNPGTTIAVVADMTDMIFLGQVDESEVGKVREGMKLEIKIGALEDGTEGTLEYISPKGKEVDGAIQFEIKAAIVPPKDKTILIRAGYSANADIVLEEKKQVLAIREAVLQFDEDGKPFVEVETDTQVFEKHPVETGLSDGIHIEIKSGITIDDVLKVPGNAGPASMGDKGRPGGAFGGGGPPRRPR